MTLGAGGVVKKGIKVAENSGKIRKGGAAVWNWFKGWFGKGTALKNLKSAKKWGKPPGVKKVTEGLPSRAKPRERGEKSLFDEKGGEWRWQNPDKHHLKGHWNYKPSGKNIPKGWRTRQMPPTKQYPNGYWKLERPMKDGSWQPINPSTMKPGRQWEVHIPLPPKK